MTANRISFAVALKFALLLSFMTLTATLAFYHEPWRDEVDTWLMARDASLSTIMKISPDVGCPVGWHFLLKPFASAGFPFGAQQTLTLLLVWTAVGILIFQGPFSLIISTCWCLSWYLSFEYSVMARSYALGILGVFALLGACSTSAPSRFRTLQWWISWPLITFSMVHFLALAPGLLLISYLLGEERGISRTRLIAAHFWPVFLSILSVWMLWPTGHGQLSDDFMPFFKPTNLLTAISLAVFPFGSSKSPPQYVAPAFLCFWLLICRLDWKKNLALVLMVSGVNSIYVFKYFHAAWRYSGLNWIIIIVAAWVGLLALQRRGSDGVRKWVHLITACLLVITLFNISDSAKSWRKEIDRPFSDAGFVAKYLIDSHQLDEAVACTSPPNCSAILGYLPVHKQFWYPGIDQWGTHMFWDRTYMRSCTLSPERALQKAKSFFHDAQGKTTFLFISNRRIPDPQSLYLIKVWESPRASWRVKDEAFTVYRWQLSQDTLLSSVAATPAKAP
jgi:hypothetical protein